MEGTFPVQYTYDYYPHQDYIRLHRIADCTAKMPGPRAGLGPLPAVSAEAGKALLLERRPLTIDTDYPQSRESGAAVTAVTLLPLPLFLCLLIFLFDPPHGKHLFSFCTLRFAL